MYLASWSSMFIMILPLGSVMLINDISRDRSGAIVTDIRKHSHLTLRLKLTRCQQRQLVYSCSIKHSARWSRNSRHTELAHIIDSRGNLKIELRPLTRLGDDLARQSSTDYSTLIKRSNSR